MVKQISDNEIYLLIKYIKKCSLESSETPVPIYIEDARCLKVNDIICYLRQRKHKQKKEYFLSTKLINPEGDL